MERKTHYVVPSRPQQHKILNSIRMVNGIFPQDAGEDGRCKKDVQREHSPKNVSGAQLKQATENCIRTTICHTGSSPSLL